MNEAPQCPATRLAVPRRDGDLIEFLRERLAYDEAFAIGWRNGGREYAGSGLPVDPARMLAEVEAKRVILAECGRLLPISIDPMTPAGIVALALARLYADHPCFDPAWLTLAAS